MMKRMFFAITLFTLTTVGGANAQSGWLSRYWDGCKPSCSWSDKPQDHGGAKTKECNRQNSILGAAPAGDPHWGNWRSSCDGHDEAFTCWDMAPWAISATESYGFAASHSAGDCGKCYELTFNGQGEHDANPWFTAINGKKLTVMISNCGGDVSQNTQFDLLLPGGGVGQFDSFNWQLANGHRTGPNTQGGICSVWPSPMDGPLGARCGGLLAGFCNSGTTAQRKTCLANKCREVFNETNENCLRQGCLWHAEWLEAANNPRYTVRQIKPCPKALVDVYTGAAQGPCTGPNPGGGGDQTTYTLTVNTTPSTGGTVTRTGSSTPGGTIASGTSVTLTATPTGTNTFTGWTGAPAGSQTSGTNGNVLTFTMPSSAVTVTANFQAGTTQNYTLTVDRNPAAGGTVMRNGSAFTSAPIAGGTSVTLTASENNGYTFTSWATPLPAGANVTGNTITFNMPNANTTVTANFQTVTTQTYTLTANVTPVGSGSVMRNGTVFTSGNINSGVQVTLTANANAGFAFDNWTGAPGGANVQGNSITFNMPDAATTVTANFRASGGGDDSDNLVKNGNFATGNMSEWGMANAGGVQAETNVNGGKLTINPLTPGEAHWQPQLTQGEIRLEQGVTYRLTFTAAAVSGSRSIMVLLQENGGDYAPYSEEVTFNLTTAETQFALPDFTMPRTDGNVQLAFNFGGDLGAGGVVISNVRLVRVDPVSVRNSAGAAASRARSNVTLKPMVGGIAATLPANHGFTSYKLLNLQGREIRSGVIGSGVTNLQLDNLRNGIFMLRLEGGSGVMPVALRATVF